MFTLLTPSALLALLGLLVPVAIHLWNRRPGREVAVGSLRWLTAGANRRLRNLKPEQLWLLLLRAALLAVLAVAVAGPAWRQTRPAGRGQVLVSPELLGTPALAALRPTIDSLRRRGYAVRQLAQDFPKVPGAAWRADSLGPRDRARILSLAGRAAADFRWARVGQAAGAFAGQPLYVVTPATLRGFQGRHLPLAANITWQMLPTGTAKTWLQTAALRDDSLRLLLGRSTETQTAFQLMSVALPRPGGAIRVAGLPALRYETGAKGTQLQPLATSSKAGDTSLLPVPVRTQPLRISIYATADYAPDARCLQAGLQAAALGLPVALALTTTTTPPNPGTPPDWLFWLADAPLPAAWRPAVSKGLNVWQEAAGPGQADKATLATEAADEGPTAVFRRGPPPSIPATASTSSVLWADGLGRAVLTRRAHNQGAYYQLHTRLSPAWSELADSPALPARLLALLQPELTDAPALAETALDRALAAHDQRTLDPAQLAWGSKSVAGQQPSLPAARAARLSFRLIDLRPWLVLAAGLLFAVERLLARRRETQALPSPL